MMNVALPDTTPVIIGVGEYVDRPTDIHTALEPVDLMARALTEADADGGGGLLHNLDSIDLVGLVSWRYSDPVSLLCKRLGVDPARKTNASMGGETPIRLIHEAAVRIARGEQQLAAIVGGEASHSRARAKKEGASLNWTPIARREDCVVVPGSRMTLHPLAKTLGVTQPAQIYPFYEMAAQAAWGQTPEEATHESVASWEMFAAVAATNDKAWLRTAPDRKTIAAAELDNRMICWPYRKLMVANPNVNQAGAVLVASLGLARKAGVPEDRLIFIWGGAAAAEADDFLQRDRYFHSTAQQAVLTKAIELAGGTASSIDQLELYSCFPIVPKMASRTLGLKSGEAIPTVTGGLTFFGGPLNNYMTHATCAMVRRLREAPADLGLLYGQGGFMNKHHALLVSARAPDQPLATNYSAQDQADANREPVPEFAAAYEGPATIETFTIEYDRNGEPLRGFVILRTADGRRTLARVSAEDNETIALLQRTDTSAVGQIGHVHIDPFGKPVWETGEQPRPRRAPRSCTVEHEGHLTIVTINRPEAMNSFDATTNAELALIFDEFSRDPAQWVAIITGAGDKAFSSGNDLKYTSKVLARGDMPETPVTGFAGLTSRFDLAKPVIAAVNGVAMGGGFEVALACDLIIACETATFALPEPKVGMAALAGGLIRLPRQIGMKRAMDLILTGRRISATEALEMGFVNRVVAPSELMSAARTIANDIIANSPMSVRASKQVATAALNEPSIDAAYAKQFDHPAVRALFRSADFREGPLAFAQKRRPNWSGS